MLSRGVPALRRQAAGPESLSIIMLHSAGGGGAPHPPAWLRDRAMLHPDCDGRPGPDAVRIMGKDRKERIPPLWKETARMVRDWIRSGTVTRSWMSGDRQRAGTDLRTVPASVP